MNTLSDRILLLTVCFFYMFYQKDITSVVISVLCAFSFSCFCLYINSQFIRIILWACYFFCGLFYTPLLFFLPLAVYDVLSKKNHSVLIVSTVFFSMVFFFLEREQCIFLLIVSGISFVLTRKSEKLKENSAELLRHKDAQQELNILMQEKQRYYLENQDYEIHLATLKERNRIAREIHDNVGHLLSRAIILVGAIISSQGAKSNEEGISTVKETLSDAMDRIRKSVHDLHDESIDMKDSIVKLIEHFTFCTAELDYDVKSDVQKDIKFCFLAIIAEALSNVIKHSNATHVSIHVWEHPALYQLLIEDNGTANPVSSSVEDVSPGIGIENMKDRIRVLQGIITITKDQGFRIFVSVQKGNKNEHTYSR